jgi:hypothetical protein
MPAHDRPFVTECRVPLEVIDAAVSARFGPARVAGNAQPAAFNRQIAMYLAKHVGGWSTTRIGKFYNGRDHSTVCHSIRRIESLRDDNPELDVQLTAISDELRLHMPAGNVEHPDRLGGAFEQCADGRILDILVERIVDRLVDRIGVQFGLAGRVMTNGQFSR